MSVKYQRLTLSVECLEISRHTYERLRLCGIDCLEDFNTFTTKELQILLAESFDEVLPTLIFYKLPRRIEDLSLSDDLINALHKVGIKDLMTLNDYDKNILFQIFNDKKNLFDELIDLLKLYEIDFDINELEEYRNIQTNINPHQINVNNSFDFVGIEFPKNDITKVDSKKSYSTTDLYNIFRNGVLIFGWNEYTKIINNSSILNRYMGLSKFDINLQKKYTCFMVDNIYHRLFMIETNIPNVSSKSKNNSIDGLYNFLSNTFIYFMNDDGSLNLNLMDNISLIKFIDNCSFELLFYAKSIDLKFELLRICIDIFKSINSSEIETLIKYPNQLQIFIDKVNSNKEKFIQSVYVEQKILSINQLIASIHPDNFNIKLEYFLPINITKKLQQFNVSTVYDLMTKNLSDILDWDIFSNNNNTLNIFLSSLNESFKEQIYDLLKNSLSVLNDTQIQILIDRKNKITLQKIGERLGVTRERARQIEHKASLRLMATDEVSKIESIIKSLENLIFLSEYEIYEMFKDVTWVFKIIFKKNWNGNFGLYIFDKYKFGNIYTNLKDSYAIEEEDYLNLDNQEKTIISKKFIKIGKHFFKKNPFIPEKYKIIIEKYYDEGLHIYDDEVLSKFKEYYKYEFENDEMNDTSNRAFSGRVTQVEGLVVVDRGYYRLDDYHISDILIEKIKNDVNSSKCLLISSLYSLNKIELNKAAITNRFQLHGVLKKYLKEYHLTRDMISISSEHLISTDEILDNYFRNRKLVKLDDMKKQIPGLTDIILSMYLANHTEYISLDFRVVIHRSSLILSNTDCINIERKISRVLEKRGYITADALYQEIIGFEYLHILEQNNIKNKKYLYNFIEHFYNSTFKFVNYIITSKNQESIKIDDLILNYIKSFDRITIKKIMEYLDINYIIINNKQKLLNQVYEIGYLRINDELLVHEKLLNIPSDVIQKIENMLIQSMINSKISTKQINDYSYFPKFSIPWNKHLLGHIIMFFSQRIMVIQIGSTYLDIEYEFEVNEL